jgi:hypothetical protein
MRDLANYTTGQRLSAQDLNALTDELTRSLKLSVQPPLALVEGPYGKTISFDDGRFLAQIQGGSSATGSAVGNTAYSFAEVCAGAHGAYSVVPGGKTGSTLYQVNDEPLSAGQIVWAFPAVDGEWGTTDGSGGGSASACAITHKIITKVCYDPDTNLIRQTWALICWPNGAILATGEEETTCGSSA